MHQIEKGRLVGITIFLILFAVGFRAYFLPYSNVDMHRYNLQWYQTLLEQGIGRALGTSFSNYSPPYTYFLAFATLFHNVIPPLIAIKLIPTLFDVVGSIFIYKIVALKNPHGYTPYFAAAIYFFAPTVMLNSSYWGQVDSLYTCFLLICLYYLLIGKTSLPMIAYGLALAIKAQAIFLMPFLTILMFQKRLPWKYFFLVPAVYITTLLPVVILGRPFSDALLVYVKQSGTYSSLSMNAPNLYFIFSNNSYQTLALLGMTAATLLISYWVYFTVKNDKRIDDNKLILYATIAVAIVPFLLPKMHDRYFYPADVLSIILAFYWPALWFVPIFYQGNNILRKPKRVC